MRAAALLLAALGGATAVVAAAPSPEAVAKARIGIDAVVEGIVQQSSGQRPANAVVLIDAPRARFRHAAARGIARADSGEPMTPDRPFLVASITKPMVAVRILQLVEAGRLTLDTTLGETGFMPADALDKLQVFGGHSYGAGLTIRQLLQHRTGLRDVLLDDRQSLGDDQESGVAPGSIGGLWTVSVPRHLECRLPGAGCTAAERQSLSAAHRWRGWDGEAWRSNPADRDAGMINFYLAEMSDAALFAPGTAFHYADTNYILLGVLIEHLTGHPLERELHEHVFQPAGMRDSYLSYPPGKSLFPGMVQPADFWFGTVPGLSSEVDLSFDWAGGGVVSTSGDLARFLQALQTNALLKMPSTREAMRACVETPARTKRNGGYGLGIRCIETRHGPMWGHSGAWGAMMFLFPQLDVTVTGTVDNLFASAQMEALVLQSIDALVQAGIVHNAAPAAQH